MENLWIASRFFTDVRRFTRYQCNASMCSGVTRGPIMAHCDFVNSWSISHVHSPSGCSAVAGSRLMSGRLIERVISSCMLKVAARSRIASVNEMPFASMCICIGSMARPSPPKSVIFQTLPLSVLNSFTRALGVRSSGRARNGLFVRADSTASG